MVDAYGDAILDVLDSKDAVSKLVKVKGIGAKTAARIKDEWEKRRGGCLLLLTTSSDILPTPCWSHHAISEQMTVV